VRAGYCARGVPFVWILLARYRSHVRLDGAWNWLL